MPHWLIVILYEVGLAVAVMSFGLPLLFMLYMAWLTRPPLCPGCRRRRLRQEGLPSWPIQVHGQVQMAAVPVYYECMACGKKWSELEEEWASVEKAEWERLRAEWIGAC